MKKIVTLTFDKSTKGTHVYKNDDFNISFYLPKLMLDDPAKPPQTIKLTIESA
jgi:hypothetical protein